MSGTLPVPRFALARRDEALIRYRFAAAQAGYALDSVLVTRCEAGASLMVAGVSLPVVSATAG